MKAVIVVEFDPEEVCIFFEGTWLANTKQKLYKEYGL